MPGDRPVPLNFDDASEADLAALIRDGARRGTAIEFQPLVYDNHFRREVSSFANTCGGYLLIGIAEKNGVATGFAPLSGSPTSRRGSTSFCARASRLRSRAFG